MIICFAFQVELFLKDLQQRVDTKASSEAYSLMKLKQRQEGSDCGACVSVVACMYNLQLLRFCCVLYIRHLSASCGAAWNSASLLLLPAKGDASLGRQTKISPQYSFKHLDYLCNATAHLTTWHHINTGLAHSSLDYPCSAHTHFPASRTSYPLPITVVHLLR